MIMPMSLDPPQTQKAPKQKSLLHATGVVASMTLLSRMAGFLRDMIIALFFGATAGVDAFFVAFKIPNFMRRLFAEGAFSQAFVPVLSEYQQLSGISEAKRFLSHVIGNLAMILTLVTIVAIMTTPLLISVFAPGFKHDASRFAMASHMLRITFPYLMFISLTAMASAVLNTYRSFAVPAFTPVLLNISIILAAIYLAPRLQQPIDALAWGVLIAGIIQLLFQLPFLRRRGLLLQPRISWKDPGVRRVLRLMVPALFGVSVAQINLLLDTVFASFLPVGSVSWLYYSDRLTNLPLGVFGVAVATVILPELSRKHALRSTQHFSMTIDWALRSILVVALPATIGLYLLAGPLLATMLGYGKFTPVDVSKARLSLMAFSVGIPAFMLIKVLAAGFYATQDIKTPAKIGMVAMVCNTLLNLALIKPMAHTGLALATSVAAFVNTGLLFMCLMRRQIYHRAPGWSKFFIQLFFANSLMAVWLYMSTPHLSEWLLWGWEQRVWKSSLLLGVAIIIYFACLYLSGIRLKQFRYSNIY